MNSTLKIRTKERLSLGFGYGIKHTTEILAVSPSWLTWKKYIASTLNLHHEYVENYAKSPKTWERGRWLVTYSCKTIHPFGNWFSSELIRDVLAEVIAILGDQVVCVSIVARCLVLHELPHLDWV